MLSLEFPNAFLSPEYEHISLHEVYLARAMIRDMFQEHPSEYPEVSWDGTQFRILPDDSTED